MLREGERSLCAHTGPLLNFHPSVPLTAVRTDVQPTETPVTAIEKAPSSLENSLHCDSTLRRLNSLSAVLCTTCPPAITALQGLEDFSM